MTLRNRTKPGFVNATRSFHFRTTRLLIYYNTSSLKSQTYSRSKNDRCIVYNNDFSQKGEQHEQRKNFTKFFTK